MRQALSETELFFALVILDRPSFVQVFFWESVSLGLSFDQMIMFCDQSEKILFCNGRKTAKTVWLESEVIRTGISQKGEGMFFTPSDSHIAPVRNRVMNACHKNALFRLMHTSFNRADGIQVWGRGRWTWHWRIEGNSGTDKNMAGLRGYKIMGDELAFGSRVCHNSRLLVAVPGCQFVYAGVPNAWRNGILYALDQTKLGSDWSRHKVPTYANPMFRDPKKKRQLIEDYGGESTQEYQTQVLGNWGDEVLRSFPPGAIAEKPTLPFWERSYGQKYIGQAIRSPSAGNSIEAIVSHLPRVDAEKYAIGIDYGYSPDPTEILVWYEVQRGVWNELAHIQLVAVISPHQARIVHEINKRLEYKTACIAIEFVGGGLGLFQELTRTDLIDSFGKAFPYKDIVIDANPGGTIEIPVKIESLVQKTKEEIGVTNYFVEDAPTITLRRKHWMVEEFRSAMIRANMNLPGLKMWLAGDESLIESIVNTSEERTDAGYVKYGRLEKDIKDHCFTAGIISAAAIIEADKKDVEDVSEELLINALGWAGSNSNWRAPW